jgi:CheY-like chemotaxis protein
VFKEIVQFDANKLQGGKGTGLGLFISRGIVELHGGRVCVHSDGLGKGCTFSFEIPLEYSAVSSRPTEALFTAGEAIGSELSLHAGRILDSPQESTVEPLCDDVNSISGNSSASVYLAPVIRLSEPIHASQRTDNPPDRLFMLNLVPNVSFTEKLLSRIRVLVVDDSALNLKMVCALLKRLGAECVTATNGSEAVEVIKGSLPIDLVVMDHMMPVMNGPEACQVMRTLGFTAPIFGLTGHALAEDVAHFVSHGASCVLKKPLDLTELKRSLAKFSLGNPLSGRLSTNGDYSRFIVDGVREYNADLFESRDSCD